MLGNFASAHIHELALPALLAPGPSPAAVLGYISGHLPVDPYSCIFQTLMMESPTLPISDLEKGNSAQTSTTNTSSDCFPLGTLSTRQLSPLRKILQWRPWTAAIKEAKRKPNVRICKCDYSMSPRQGTLALNHSTY